MLARHVDAVVVSLGWKRTVVVEQGRWVSRSTPMKPHGDNVRNLRTVKKTEADIVGGSTMRNSGASIPRSRAYEVLAEHTYFEYEEFEWRKYRTFSAKGDGPADLHWPECALEPDQRITDRREAYHATFAVNGDSDADEYPAELDEAVWRTLKLGKRYRLTVSLLSGEVKQVSPVRDGSHR